MATKCCIVRCDHPYPQSVGLGKGKADSYGTGIARISSSGFQDSQKQEVKFQGQISVHFAIISGHFCQFHEAQDTENAPFSVLTNLNQPSRSGWLFTNVCRTYATTDVVRPTAYLRYDLFTTSVTNLWQVIRQIARVQHYSGPLVPSRNLFIFVSATF